MPAIPAPVKSNGSYSYAQLESIWIQAGGSRAKAPIMAAISLAESGGRPNAVSPKNSDGTVDRGLWQINSIHGALSSLDPLANAKAAVKIEGTQGLTAWTVYKTGAYKKFLKGGVAPDNNLPSGSTPAQGGTADQAGLGSDLGGAIGQGFATAFAALVQPLISFAIWGTEIMLGGVLLLVGVLVFLANTEKGKEVTKDVGALAVNAATTAAAPEAEPAVAAATITKLEKSKQNARAVKSKKEFEQTRKSGYSGPIRHDY